MSESTLRVDLMRMTDGQVDAVSDRVAVEAPLEVRLNGHPFAAIMRTPGADADLTAGFLFSEGVIRLAADIERIDALDAGNTMNVVLSRGRAEILPELLSMRRNVVQNASCGFCGRRSLESLDIEGPPLSVDWHLDTTVVSGFPALLRGAQHAFDETGGLHAAGLFDLAGGLHSSAEDIGRHNAVDKILGRMLAAGRLPLSRSALFVSGRSSFEIVQKAFLAGVPLVASVSAPSSFAVDLAKRTGITLAGFVRGDRFNVYAHPTRLRPRATGQPYTQSAPQDSPVR
jgi:FdhD protein